MCGTQLNSQAKLNVPTMSSIPAKPGKYQSRANDMVPIDHAIILRTPGLAAATRVNAFA